MKFVAILCCLALTAAEKSQTFNGPTSASEAASWREGLVSWREETIKKDHYDGAVFNEPSLKWTQTSFLQTQMHPYDRYFFDPVKGYTVDRFLQDAIDKYGGIDAMLMWPTYPVIGIDDRNQYDYFRAMPGGLPAVKKVIDELHARGVKVLLPYNPWDLGTRREEQADSEVMAQVMKTVDADGFNGDTMPFIPKEFYDASSALGHKVALEPEGDPDSVDMTSESWTPMGWGYWGPYEHVPYVDKFKWLDSRRLTHVCARWAKSRTEEIQHAFFNGVGYETWENVWGCFNGITPYDGESIRRVAAMLRFFGAKGFTTSPLWEPHTPVEPSQDVFASKFTLGSDSVWFVVNRANGEVGAEFRVPSADNLKWFDCYHGTELFPTPIGNSTFYFAFGIEKFGCLFATPNPDAELSDFLYKMSEMTMVPLYDFEKFGGWKYLSQRQVPAEVTTKYATAPAGTVHIPFTSEFVFNVSGVEVEGGIESGVDVQYAWETHPIRNHFQTVSVGPIYMDKYPVTCAEFEKYLEDTNYTPAESFNFLKNWRFDNGTYSVPPGYEKKPVTYVSLEEARGYCLWAGKRLPSEIEWQYAAQGLDGRHYPWGDDLDQSKFPVQSNGRTLPGPEDVDAHSPAGDSPFGVADLVGNVWQYTTEFQDDHTRSVILRGSANYRPSGSMWYFPNALELNKHNKMFLMSDSYERAGTLGFRCAVDAAN